MRYCSIQKWIEENDKKLYEFLEDNCLLGIFKFRHGTSGVTFLCPSNWKSIEKDIESGDYVNGVNTLKAHVLQGFYPDLDGLMEQKDGLVNSLGQVVEVKSKSGSTVLLKDGGKVTEVKPKFQGTPDRSNIMVFTYDGSLLPTNAPAGSLKYTSAPSGKQSKSGGGFRGMNKLSLTKGVEQRALNLIRQQSASGDSDSKLYMSHNPYAAALVSLYTYANMAAPDKVNELYSLLDVFPEQAFYATINPYGQSSLDGLIQNWIEETGGIYAGANPAADYLLIMKIDSPKGSEATAMPGKPEAMIRAIPKLYKSDAAKLNGDAMRWFIAVRLAEEPQLFSNPQKFITLVYDLAVLFSSGSTEWINNPMGAGPFLAGSRYCLYNFNNAVPSEAASVAQAMSGGMVGEGHIIAQDEAGQVELLRKAAAAGSDSDEGRYAKAKAALDAFRASAVKPSA
jgi:hypothetical protein